MLCARALSERRACRLVGLSHSAFRHRPEPTAATQALSARIIELAQVRRRFGYRWLHDLVRPEFPDVNHKKVLTLPRFHVHQNVDNFLMNGERDGQQSIGTEPAVPG